MKNLKINKKIILFTICGSILLALIISIYIYQSTQNTQTTSEDTIEIPDTTGKEITNEPLSETKSEEQLGFLIESSPVNTERFSLIFSFKENKFKVTLTPATKENYDAFTTWLTDNGLDQISPDRFIYTNYSP